MFKKKLILVMVTLISCLSLTGQPNHTSLVHAPFKDPVFDFQDISVINLEGINSSNHDYCPVVLERGILFSSDRPSIKFGKDSNANFYISKFDEDGILQKPDLIEGVLNSKYQEGMASISPDRKAIIFSREVEDIELSQSFSNVRLFSAKFNKNKWVRLRKMSLNLKGVSSGHPAFSPDGKELYFVSNRPGGYGGSDIYVSRFENNKWQDPVNLGPAINTSGNELFPFIDSAENLYFSTDQGNGFGGLDIYSSNKDEDGNWIQPKNMGEPINSKANDFGIYVFPGQTRGYLTSDRKEGLGGNDLYAWSVIPETVTKQDLIVVVVDKENNSKVIDASLQFNENQNSPTDWRTDAQGLAQVHLTDSEVTSFRINHPDYKARVVDLTDFSQEDTILIALEKQGCIMVSGQLIDENGAKVVQDGIRMEIENHTNYSQKEFFTEADGSFEICLSCGYDFSVKTLPDGYYAEEVFVSTRGVDCEDSETIIVTVPLIEVEEQEMSGQSTSMNELVEEKTASEIDATTSFLESISNEEEVNMSTIEEVHTPVEEEVVEVVLPEVYFDFDSYSLKENDRKELETLGSYLEKNPELELTVKSYTDPVGTQSYNKWLAKRRAESVIRYLTETGIELTRMKAIAVGEEKDLAGTNDNTIKRRAEFEINKAEKESTSASSESEMIQSAIYYSFDDYQLNDDSKIEVDKAIERIMQNDQLSLEVLSHTDARGSAQYNQWLSQKRANAVVKYVTQKGIDISRVKGTGFGEARLLNDCDDGSSCTKSEHAENRRTEFVFFQTK